MIVSHSPINHYHRQYHYQYQALLTDLQRSNFSTDQLCLHYFNIKTPQFTYDSISMSMTTTKYEAR